MYFIDPIKDQPVDQTFIDFLNNLKACDLQCIRLLNLDLNNNSTIWL